MQSFTKRGIQTNEAQFLSHINAKIRHIFCKLVIIAKARDFDLYNVDSQELRPIPWRLATSYETLYKSEKSALLPELEKKVAPVHAVLHGSVWVYDLFANIQCLKEPANIPHQKWKPKTFASVEHSILAIMCNIFSNAPKIDIVVDHYFEHSIKNDERSS